MNIMAKGETDANAFTDGTSVAGLTIGSGAAKPVDHYTGHNDNNNSGSYQGPNLDGSAGYTVDYGSSSDGSDDTYTTSGGTVMNDVTGEKGFVADTLVGKVISYLGGVDPSSDSVATSNGVVYYTRSDGTMYSYNMLGLPYDIALEDNGDVKDATDYTQLNTLMSSGNSGDRELAQTLQVSKAINLAAEQGTYDLDSLNELLSESGLDVQNEEIKTLLNDPKSFLDAKGINLTNKIPTIDALADGTNIDATKAAFTQGENPNYSATSMTNVASTVAPDDQQAATFNAKTIGNDIDAPAYMVDAQTDTVSDNAQVDANDFLADMEGIATGINSDGTRNFAGEALNQYATQDISRIIDTTTVSGKLLADKLGEGNYTDAKSTILGQMKIISAEFKDGQGNPKIPTWAQSTARNVQKTIAFKGMTGTAATAALSNAMMESTLGIAEKEASFFQTLTIKNLDNRQEAFINKANTLSKFELANLDAREAAAIQNAQTFFTLDLKNLDNEQQSEIINKKARVDALFEDQKVVNAQRLFSAEQENDMQKYYDGLIMRANEATALATNEMKRFNAGEINDASEFNAKVENDRDQFYSNMQYNIDLSNAKWRQSVVETDTQMKFDAASTDVKNLLDLSQEGLNRLWDRVDANLDFLFKASENEADRDRAVLVAQIQAQAGQQESNSSGGLFGFLGNIAGTIAGTLDWGTILGLSDVALKENIRRTGTAENGLGLYEWDWTEEGSKISKGQRSKGYLAQEVAQKYPQAVKVGEDGHLRINYRKLA